MISLVYFNFVIINTITKRSYCFKYFKIIYLLARLIKQMISNNFIFISFNFMMFIFNFITFMIFWEKFLHLILFDVPILNLLKHALTFVLNLLFVFQKLSQEENKYFWLGLLFDFDEKTIFRHL